MPLTPSTTDLTATAVVFDLDDTLFHEADYVASARREIARRIAERYPSTGLTVSEMLAVMESYPFHGPGAFDALEAALPREVAAEATVDWMRRVYRSHRPDISLAEGVEDTLRELAARGATLGIITDGRVETQSLKLDALAMARFISPALTSISEGIGADKYSSLPFERMERLTPQCPRRFYVGDNLAKDFIHPRAMGWTAVRVDYPADSRRIFNAPADSFPPSHQPHAVISSLPALLDIL